MNNPFGTPQSVVESTSNRFPNIELPQSQQIQQQQPSQQYQQQQPQQQFDPYQQQQQQYTQPIPPQLTQQQSYSQFQPQQQFQSQPQLTTTNSSGFIPQTGFGQQLSAQVTGYQNNNNGVVNGGGGAGGGYNNNIQQNNFLDLDPYASLSSTQIQSQSNQSQSLPTNLSSTQQRVSHPRQYVQEQKTLLMSWDDYAWKQLLGKLDSLREAWEARKQALLDLARRGGDPTQVDHLEREATSNIDSIHASKMQLSEVQSGWRFSTDIASKARVREALNAGLTSLPEYPSNLSSEQIGGVFHQKAQDDYRKQSIMQGFNSSQQQQYPQQMQQQYTGYPQSNPYPQQQQQQQLLPQQQQQQFQPQQQQPQQPQYYYQQQY